MNTYMTTIDREFDIVRLYTNALWSRDLISHRERAELQHDASMYPPDAPLTHSMAFSRCQQVGDAHGFVWSLTKYGEFLVSF